MTLLESPRCQDQRLLLEIPSLLTRTEKRASDPDHERFLICWCRNGLTARYGRNYIGHGSRSHRANVVIVRTCASKARKHAPEPLDNYLVRLVNATRNSHRYQRKHPRVSSFFL